MSKRRETARKDAHKSGCAQCAGEKKITLTIEGKQYENLKRIADAMNTVSWCDTDNTPETVWKGFVEWGLTYTLDSIRELCEQVEGGIDTGFERSDETKHLARIAELRAAFKPLLAD